MELSSPVKPDKIYTVTEITRLIKRQLEDAFPNLWVEGEISDFRRAHSGHLYFSLKDETSQLRAVMWRSSAARVAFTMENGLQVVCRGPITVYEPRGQYQFIVELVEPKGKGALQLAFEQLREKLNKEGLFDPSRKKKLPLLPKRVGVVTSPRGAAVIDILRTLERRFAKLHILIYPARVQGEGAAEEIVEGIDLLGRMPGVDVLIVGRGGGSIEDLWAFNEEKVARAIVRCPVPVISAVGHEIDFTIADFVADIRASTPSAAAEILIDKEQAFEERIDNLESRMIHFQKYAIQQKKHRVLELIHHRAFRLFRERLLTLVQRVDELEERARSMIRSLQQKITESRSRARLLEERMGAKMREKLQVLLAKWERLSAELDGLSPLSILKKGYTLCWKDGGRRLVRTADEVAAKDEVAVSFFKGELTCEVKAVDAEKPIGKRLSNDKIPG